MSSRLASIDLTQEMLDEESREKLKVKWGGSKISWRKGNFIGSHSLTEDKTMWDMEKNRYGMYLYWYKQKNLAMEVLLAHIGLIQTLKAIPPSLASSVGLWLFPPQHSGQVPSKDTIKMVSLNSWKGCCSNRCTDSSATNNSAACPTECATSGSISLIDSQWASVAGTQGVNG